uniref:Receptor L-domain domain-containing protein n=1 Tax=Chromera velia CCMP2878 TaxID=1169474 RepID=A0A0G4FZQ5_9ALVE|mmetsp:Transcript_11460/g.22077  ORF Transcript_11460/g.22077 Transcript_11460/m.22077 type:complete len:502 (-) Transcript_11460:506-2011(-)|eukprot:Cvel_19491.t1-p1 / transcript=Cvel_19491.t1 / gene=Cvel_19491 / organism=Chromera_velia_CCMP2878 / gene_product=hypothetical protein / transcript_product=hypothetical protein / location=Cvel_scaffold1684:33847-36101(-) / protein_length=501 / sequence_SO=supercontig / SO=protein_coding / is_pseudo=false
MYRCRIAHSCLLVGLLSSVALSKTDFDLALLKDLDPSSIDLKGLKGLEGLDGLKGLEGLGEFDLFSDKLGLLKGEKNKKKEVCGLPKLPKFDCPAPPPPCTVSNTRTESFNTEEGDGCNLSPLAGVCRIEGNLVLRGCRFTDLEPLSSLREVTGTVRFESLLHLRSFDPLSALVSVGGDLVFNQLPLVPTLSPPGFCNLNNTGSIVVAEEARTWKALEIIFFPNLKKIAGALETSYLAVKTEAILLPSLQEIDDRIQVQDPEGLTVFYAPELVSAGEIEFTDNCALETVWFPKLEEVGGIQISGNVALSCVNLESLKNADLEINDHTNLQVLKLDSFQGSTQGRSTDLTNLGLLKVLSLPSLQTSGLLAIYGSLYLEEISAPLLTTVLGELELEDLPALKKLHLPSLTSIDGLSITQTQLPNLDAFSGVSMVAGGNSFLSIQHNTKLTSVEGLSNAVSAGVFLEAQICDNPSLSSLPASFSNLTADDVICDTSDPVCDCSF